MIPEINCKFRVTYKNTPEYYDEYIIVSMVSNDHEGEALIRHLTKKEPKKPLIRYIGGNLILVTTKWFDNKNIKIITNETRNKK